MEETITNFRLAIHQIQSIEKKINFDEYLDFFGFFNR